MKRRDILVAIITLAVAFVTCTVQIDAPEYETETTPYTNGLTPEATPTAEPTMPSPEGETVVNFLRQFITISVFSDYQGWYDLENGEFYARSLTDGKYTVTPYQAPLYYMDLNSYGRNLVLLDRNGTLITDGIFLRLFEEHWDDNVFVHKAYADHFYLYDLCPNGSPVIMIHFSRMYDARGNDVIFQYIDGEYREVYAGGHLVFLTDSQGNIYLRDNGTSNHITKGGTFYSVAFTSTGMTHTLAPHILDGAHGDEIGWQDMISEASGDVLEFIPLNSDLYIDIVDNVHHYFAQLPTPTIAFTLRGEM